MKVTELRGKSVSDLNVELVKQLEQQFKLSMRKATGQLAQTHLLKAAKKDVARIKTVINEKAVK